MAITPDFKKRFWKDTRVVSSESGFEVFLDDRALRTPAKSALRLPNAELAQAVADEWQAQAQKVDPATMPMTRRANVAIDKVRAQKHDVADMLAAYGGSDLLCYRTEYPQELADRQAKMWDPLLDWARDELKVDLLVTKGVMPVQQDDASLTILRQHVHGFDHFALTGFHDLVTNSGSLILGIAAAHGDFPVEELWQASQVDEIWQSEQWGEDDEAKQALANKRQDFLDAHRFYRFVAGT